MALGPIETPSYEQVVAIQRFLQRGKPGRPRWSLDDIFMAVGESRWTILGGVDGRSASVDLAALRELGLPAELLEPTQQFYSVQRAAGLELDPPELVFELLCSPAFAGMTHLRMLAKPERVQVTFMDQYDPTWHLSPSDWLELPQGAEWQHPRPHDVHAPLSPAQSSALRLALDDAQAVCAKGLEPCRCRDGIGVSFRTGAGAEEYDTHSCHIGEHPELRTFFTRVIDAALASITDEASHTRLSHTREYIRY